MKTYISASFDNPVPRWLRKDKEALKALSKAGLDLKSSVFHHDSIGRGKSYPVYAIKNESNEDLFVWIPGIYNDEYRVSDPYSGSYTAIKYVPKKHLNIVDIVYVSKDAALKPEREHYQDPRYTEGNRTYRGQVYDKARSRWVTFERWRGDKYDKSGYQIPDPAEKLANWYRQGKSSKLKSRVDKVYQILKDLQARISTMRLDADGPDDSLELFGGWMRSFGSVVDSYRRFLRRYKSPLESGEISSWEASSILEDLRRLERDVQYLQKNAETL